MANRIAGAPMPATINAGTSPTKGLPNRRPTPPMRRVEQALPEPIEVFDVLYRVEELGTRWWSIIDCVLENHRARAGNAEPLPEWALRILTDQGRHSATEDEFRTQRTTLREMLRLQEGASPTFTYEVWGDRTTRLSTGHDCVADALPARDFWRTNGHPNASILKFRKVAHCCSASVAEQSKAGAA